MGAVNENPLVNRYTALMIAVMTAVSVLFLITPYPLAALLPGLALMAIMVVDRRPELAFFAILALIPFGEFRNPEGPFSFIRVHWILGILLVMLIFLHCLPQKNAWRNLRSNLWLPITGLIAAQLLSACWSAYPQTAFVNVALTLSAFAFVAVCLYFLPQMQIYRRILPAVLVWSISAGSALAILGYFFGISLFAEKVSPGEFRRGLGGAPDPNNMALMVIFVLPLVFHWLLHSRNPIKRLVAGLLLLVNLMAIVTTFSRGGALILIITMVGLLLEYRHRIRVHFIGLALAGLILVTGLAVWLVPPDYWQRQHSLVEASDSAMLRRASYVKVATRAFLERPVLGHGPGTFPEIYAKTDYAERYKKVGQSKKRPAHNTYLEILVGGGLVAFLPFMALLWTALRNYTRARRTSMDADDLELMVLTGSYRLAFVSLLIYLLIFSDPYHKYLMLALALSHAAITVTGPREKTES